MTTSLLLVKKLSDKATLPRRASPGAAGYDLSSAINTVVPAHGKQCIPTDIACKFPPTVYGKISPRSGLAWNNFIDVGAGVIDSDFSGNIGVILFNHSDVDFDVKVGDRIAQLILETIETPAVKEVNELEETERGAGGFGSTGLHAISKDEVKKG